MAAKRIRVQGTKSTVKSLKELHKRQMRKTKGGILIGLLTPALGSMVCGRGNPGPWG